MRSQDTNPGRMAPEAQCCEFNIYLLNEEGLNELKNQADKPTTLLVINWHQRIALLIPNPSHYQSLLRHSNFYTGHVFMGSREEKPAPGGSMSQKISVIKMEKRTWKRRMCWQTANFPTTHNSHRSTTCLLEEDNQVHLSDIWKSRDAFFRQISKAKTN